MIIDAENATIDESSIVYAERVLWRAVIAQAIKDIIHHESCTNTYIDKCDALDFFSRKEGRFTVICAAAGYDVDYAYDKVVKYLRSIGKMK